MYSETPDIIPFASPFKSELLTQAELETLKGGTLRLLDEVGVHFPSRMALEIFADHGARVDMDTEIVRIPPDLVEKAMSTAPRSFVLGGREERFDLLLDGSCSYLCTDGTGVHVVDLETREKRPSRKEDVAMMARVCDALPLISFYWPLVSAQDYGRTAPLHQCHAGLTNTLKHVRGGMTVLPQLAPYIVEMGVRSYRIYYGARNSANKYYAIGMVHMGQNVNFEYGNVVLERQIDWDTFSLVNASTINSVEYDDDMSLELVQNSSGGVHFNCEITTPIIDLGENKTLIGGVDATRIFAKHTAGTTIEVRGSNTAPTTTRNTEWRNNYGWYTGWGSTTPSTYTSKTIVNGDKTDEHHLTS